MGSDANRSGPSPSVDEVQRIVAIAYPVIRNLEITHCCPPFMPEQVASFSRVVVPDGEL